MTTEKQKTLSDIFNAFARDAAIRFPHLAGKMAVMDMNEEKLYGHDIDLSAIRLKTWEDLSLHFKNEDGAKELRKNPHKSSTALLNDSTGLRVIFINERIAKKSWGNVSLADEKLLLSILDHELSHIAIRNAGYDQAKDSLHKQMLGESIADAYALIRHYQRFGTYDAYSDLVSTPVYRTLRMLDDDAAHFTAFVIEEISKRRHDIDFNSLTAQQTADLAWRFAVKYTPPEPVIAVIKHAFEPYRKAEGRWEDIVRVLAELTLSPETGYYAFRTGSILLHTFLKAEKTVGGKTTRLEGPYWDDVREKLKTRQAEMDALDVMFNLPLAPKPPAAKKAKPVI